MEDSFDVINSSGTKPLAAYLFTNNKKLKQKFVATVSAGGLVVNDTTIHLAENTLPFGRVGVPVVYMGTISSKTAGLRGIITDGGILCSYSLCKGHRVIPPSQFEIHACKQYKRAAQYICFENGKSLLEVLRACRRRPLHTLEATI